MKHRRNDLTNVLHQSVESTAVAAIQNLFSKISGRTVSFPSKSNFVSFWPRQCEYSVNKRTQAIFINPTIFAAIAFRGLPGLELAPKMTLKKGGVLVSELNAAVSVAAGDCTLKVNL